MFRQLTGLFQKRSPREAAPADERIVQARELLDSGQIGQAEQLCRKITAAEPQHAEAWGMLGKIAVHRGKNDLAVRNYSRAVDIDAEQPSFRQGLAIAHFSAGNVAEALRVLQDALALDPQDPALHNNLGNCHRRLGDLAAAADCYRKAVSLNAEYLSAYGNLAAVLRQQGEFEAVVDTCRKALRINADAPEIRFHLAMALHATGKQEEAISMLRELALSHPDYPGLLIELGLVLAKAGEVQDAIACFQDAIARQPKSALAHNCLGAALVTRNDMDGAMACFRKALTIKPDFARVHANLLMIMNYQPGWRQKRLCQEAQQFDQRQARRLMPRPLAFDNAPDPDRVLRVGYVSPDFREHSVAYFIRQLPGVHNREQVEVFCYSDVGKADADAFTRAFEAQADTWRPIAGMEDDAVAALVREDGIDILVDLAGHTSNNRLLAFARKPAPVQVTWLGYPNTTGMRAMDYRLTDAVADPPGEPEKLHVEKLVRLPHGFLCFQGDDLAPEVAPPPSVAEGRITLGSFNTTKKVTSEVIHLWARLLQAIPGSRLLLKSDSLKDDWAKERLLKLFDQQGIAADRLEMLANQPSREAHLKMYSRVDLCVDTFPYNGTTTTCEALWMGVPVVCLRGDRHASRVGASILHHVGLTELIAGSLEQYLQIAQALAGDAQRLAGLRGTLREKMRASPLMDLPLFTDALEAAYRDMWKTWCDRGR